MGKRQATPQSSMINNTTPDIEFWREFELLVARLEFSLCPRGAVITSPDRLRDKFSGELREVDATIRYRIGTTDLLLMIECRSRKRAEGSAWIEQLFSKQQAVGASKCVAVSAAGFTGPARRKAALLGIELRHLSSAANEDPQSYAPMRTWFFGYALGRVSLTISDGKGDVLPPFQEEKLNDELLRKYGLDEPCLETLEDAKTCSIREYVLDTINHCYDKMPDHNKLAIPVGKPIVMSWAGDSTHKVATSQGVFELLGVGFWITFNKFFDYALEHRRSYVYATPHSPLVLSSEYEAQNKRDGRVRGLTIYKDMRASPAQLSALWHPPARK